MTSRERWIRMNQDQGLDTQNNLWRLSHRPVTRLPHNLNIGAAMLVYVTVLKLVVGGSSRNGRDGTSLPE